MYRIGKLYFFLNFTIIEYLSNADEKNAWKKVPPIVIGLVCAKVPGQKNDVSNENIAKEADY